MIMTPKRRHLTVQRADLFAAIATAAYIAAVAAAASISGFVYILFPELGALAFDVLRRPRGVWASAPVLTKSKRRANPDYKILQMPKTVHPWL